MIQTHLPLQKVIYKGKEETLVVLIRTEVVETYLPLILEELDPLEEVRNLETDLLQ